MQSNPKMQIKYQKSPDFLTGSIAREKIRRTNDLDKRATKSIDFTSLLEVRELTEATESHESWGKWNETNIRPTINYA